MAILEIEGLSKTYRIGFWGVRKTALRGVDIRVEENEIFGYLGPNGAGKTTTLKSILGLIKPSAGQIKMFGQPSSEITLKENIGYMPENPYFYTYLTAAETLDFYARLFNLSKATRQKRARELLERVGLADVRDVILRNFSKGMLQRIGIAQALINDPKLIIFDEPMSGLDPVGRKEVRDIILDLKKEGKTIFFSSHILSDVEMICDRVAIIFNGKIVQIGNLEEMRAAKIKTIEITACDLSTAAFEKIQALNLRSLHSAGQYLIFADSEPDRDRVIKTITEWGGKIISVTPNKASLEDIFMAQVREVNHESN